MGSERAAILRSDSFDLAPVGEGVQPFRAKAQLAGQLGASQQQHGDEGSLVGSKLELIVEGLVIFDRLTASVGPHDPHEPSIIEVARDSLDSLLVAVDDGLSVADLVAPGATRVGCQRTRGRHCCLLIQETAQDALVNGIENRERAHAVDSRADAFRPFRATACREP